MRICTPRGNAGAIDLNAKRWLVDKY